MNDNIPTPNITDMINNEGWLNRLEKIVNEHLSEVNINNGMLASEINISERHFSRKVKKLTGMSPRKYIRQQRMYRAKKLLETGTHTTVKEVAAMVGYVNTGYFISQFERAFGKRPLEVLKESGWR